MTPHPQRCETCDHREIVHNYGMGTHRPRCKITKWFLDAYAPTTIEHDFIDKLGCASHSSATHTPAAPAMEYTIEQIAEIDNRIRKERKAERDQVLDAYAAWDNTHWTTQRVKEYKESLRGGGAP